MFDQIAMASEALQASVLSTCGTMVPALCGCPKCQTLEMIAGPTLGRCVDCGEDRVVMVFKDTMPHGSPVDLGVAAAA